MKVVALHSVEQSHSKDNRKQHLLSVGRSPSLSRAKSFKEIDMKNNKQGRLS